MSRISFEKLNLSLPMRQRMVRICSENLLLFMSGLLAIPTGSKAET